MNMDYKKCLQNMKKKKAEYSDTNNKKIQLRYKNGIWHRKYAKLIMNSGKKTNDRRNEITESGKSQKTYRKGNLQVLWNAGVDIIKRNKK